MTNKNQFDVNIADQFNIPYDSMTIQFYLICHSLFESKNENIFAANLSKYIETIQIKDFKNINNVKNVILNIKHEKLLFAYKMALICYAKSQLSSQISKYLKLKCNCDIVFIVNKIKSLKQDEQYMKSYLLIQPLNKLMGMQNVKDDFNYKYDKFTSWYFETRIDIINRLSCLRNYFGLEMLQLFKIKNTSYEEIINFDFKKLAKFYNKVIMKIKENIKMLLEICDAYLEVENVFVTSLMNVNSSIDTNIKICEKNVENIDKINTPKTMIVCDDFDDKHFLDLDQHLKLNDNLIDANTNDFDSLFDNNFELDDFFNNDMLCISTMSDSSEG